MHWGRGRWSAWFAGATEDTNKGSLRDNMAEADQEKRESGANGTARAA